MYLEFWRITVGISKYPKVSREVYNCHCVCWSLGPLYLIWQGNECRGYFFERKARYYKVLGYLDHRKDRQKHRQED